MKAPLDLLLMREFYKLFCVGIVTPVETSIMSSSFCIGIKVQQRELQRKLQRKLQRELQRELKIELKGLA